MMLPPDAIKASKLVELTRIRPCFCTVICAWPEAVKEPARLLCKVKIPTFFCETAATERVVTGVEVLVKKRLNAPDCELWMTTSTKFFLPARIPVNGGEFTVTVQGLPLLT